MKTHNLPAMMKGISLLVVLTLSLPAFAQDEEAAKSDKKELARPAFESALLGEMQSVVVQTPKTLEWDFMHRFGTVENGLKDFYGIYAPGANIRMGLTYTPMDKLAVGIGLTKANMALDLNAKYAVFRQSKDNSMPVSVSYFGNVVANTQAGNYKEETHRLSFYNELIVAKRFNSKISVQISPSFTHYNAVDTLYSNDMFAVGVGARYKFSAQSSIIINYVQPLMNHKDSKLNAQPGLAIVWEIATSAHAFQIFFSNYQGILPQNNIMYNQNKWGDSKFLLGFNITRLWNF
ncbi:MAG: hypothetical protein JNL40_06005 [Cyclobacteriaceae bacterium]|nr:hypothetical protein [Cyclobacteriaceae bacterium]